MNNKPVLVHCHRGVSRSATVVIAYMMKFKNIGMLEAFNFVKIQRPIIDPNFGFLIQLQAFEEQILISKHESCSIDDREQSVRSLRDRFEQIN